MLKPFISKIENTDLVSSLTTLLAHLFGKLDFVFWLFCAIRRKTARKNYFAKQMCEQSC